MPYQVYQAASDSLYTAAPASPKKYWGGESLGLPAFCLKRGSAVLNRFIKLFTVTTKLAAAA